jgi:hypothetical protein
MMEDSTKQYVKEVKGLPKKVLLIWGLLLAS